MENAENAIEVRNVYKTFNVYYDRANTLKERLLFIGKRNKKEKRKRRKDKKRKRRIADCQTDG